MTLPLLWRRLLAHAARPVAKLFPLIAIIALQSAGATAHAQAAWKNVNISGSGCWVTGIVAQPKVPNLFYIRTDVGGCYRWDNAAGAWAPITDFIPLQQRYNYGCESIAVDPNDPNTVYIACGMWLKNEFNAGPGTIYKSTDRGQAWAALGLSGVYMGSNDNLRWGGERLAIQPGRAGRSRLMLFGSRMQGLWRSVDAGAHWSQTSLPYPASNDDIGVQAVAFDPNAPDTAYAAVAQDGIFKSLDGGAAWTNISTAITSPRRLVVAPDSTVWVTYGNGVGKFSAGKWTDCTPAGAAAQAYSGLAINPSDVKNVIVSYGLWNDPHPDAIFETWDAGLSWTRLSANITTNVPWYQANSPHGIDPDDISQFLFDPNNPKSVWFVSGGGIWNTPDIGHTASPTFYHKEKGHEELCVMALAAPPIGPELLTGVMDVDGFVFDKGIDANPSRSLGMTGSWASATTSISYEESDPKNMVRLCVQGTPWNCPTIVATSNDEGRTWTQDKSFPTISPSGDKAVLAPQSVVLSATDPGNILADVIDFASGDNVWLYRTSAASGWRQSVGLPVGKAASGNTIAADPVARATFYAYTGGAVYRSSDGGASFQQVSSGPVGASGQAGFSKLAAQPGAEGDLWLSEDDDNPNYLGDDRPAWEGLYHSRDGGRSWSKLPGVSRALTFAFGARSPGGPYTLYFYGRLHGQTADRIYRSTDLGRSWVDIQHPGQAIGDGPWVMEGSRQKFGRVFIGTGGRGIFYSVYTPALSNHVASHTRAGQRSKNRNAS